MSFILDALKRADAERAHGRVPGLHTQAILPGRPAPAQRQPANPYLLLLGGVALALLCLALWNWLKPPALATSTAPAALPPVAALSTPTPLAAPAPPAAPVAAAVRPVTPASAAPAAAAAPAIRSAPSTNPRAAPKTSAPPKPPEKPVAPAKRRVEAQAQAQAQAQPVTASPKAPTANPSPALSDLPQDIRQALPKIVISGSIYSETAAHRMLIINGQVFREGEKPAPNLELEQIKPKTAIFNFKGQRYSMGY